MTELREGLRKHWFRIMGAPSCLGSGQIEREKAGPVRTGAGCEQKSRKPGLELSLTATRR